MATGFSSDSTREPSGDGRHFQELMKEMGEEHVLLGLVSKAIKQPPSLELNTPPNPQIWRLESKWWYIVKVKVKLYTRIKSPTLSPLDRPIYSST
jgi:hypothetical protein